MAQKQQREVKDADHVIREYYEGEESGLQGAFRDQLETYSTGDEGGHDRMKDSARNPTLTGGDVDAGWEYADIGEETVGGDNPTPDQDIVDDLGEAAGVTYQDTEPLNFGEKMEQRDLTRWELDPASSDDYRERVQLNENEVRRGDGQTTTGGETEY